MTCVVVCANAATYYVSASRPDDSGDGTTWATAKHTIQAAVDLAGVGDTILVTNGVYNEGGAAVTPGSSVTNRVCCDKNVIITAMSTNPSDTVIAGAPDPDTSGCGPKAIRCLRGHCYGPYPVVTGFTFTNGYCWNAGGVNWQDQYGGGVWGGVLSNCLVTGNTSESMGGGFSYGVAYYCTFVGNTGQSGGGIGPSVRAYSCLVTNNSAHTGAGAYSSYLYDCLITGNSANYGGGVGPSTMASNCVIRGNSAGVRAGAAGGTQQTKMWFYNCLITDNEAPALAIYQRDQGVAGWYVTIINTTIVSNRATTAGACAGVGFAGFGTITNSIIRLNMNTTDGVETNYSVTTNTCIGYSCTWPDVSGAEYDNGGNIGGNPVFTEDGDFTLEYRSPCVDAGINISTLSNDLNGVTRPIDGKVDGAPAYDMGCYEYIPPDHGMIMRLR